MQRIRALMTLLSITVLLTSGCTPVLRSKVVAFYEDVLPAGETIRVEAMGEADGQSLEFRRYAKLVADELRKVGYEPVGPGEDAQLIAEVDYKVDMGPVDVRYERNRPYVHYYFHYGRYRDPVYFGVTQRWDPELSTAQTYNRTLSMNIVRNDETRERIFESRVESPGYDRQLPEVMPYLITAMFTNFPGENGVTKVVTIEMDR